MKNLWIITLLLVCLSCNSQDEIVPVEQQGQGHEMLLIGNSFFKPYANHLEVLALDAGFENHNASLVFRGGDNGRAINFWNDSDSSEHNEIKSVLDQGNIEYFGMTAGAVEENPTDGFSQWISYALKNNPEVIIFISIPPVDFPAEWDQRAEEYGFNSIQELYTYFVNSVHELVVTPLRAEFPGTQIFTIPTGWATVNLAQMNQDNLLLDNITMFGPKATSIFTDQKGHQGQIAIETGTLLWLNSIYKVNLSTNSYDTGFNTDLHEIANQIMDLHDSNYKQ